MLSAFQRFEKIAIQHPDYDSIEVDGINYTYGTLYKISLSISSVLIDYPEEKYVGILSYRSLTTYAGILGTLASGKCYVPFSPKFPHERIRKIISFVGCKIFITDREFIPSIFEIVGRSIPGAVIIAPEESFNGVECLPGLKVYNKDYLTSLRSVSINQNKESDPAYLLFTSGSTGEPKGIAISNLNLSNYIEYISKIFPLVSHDKCTQLFDTTFDLSVHDMFVTWNAGAKLIIVPKNLLLAPVKYLAEREVTIWFSVPSTVAFLVKMKLLRKNILPKLRMSFFCGEALTVDLVKAWQEASPNSRIINLYGPTETTISISYYEWDNTVSEEESRNNIVPLGKVFENHNIAILDDQNHVVKEGEPGELSISGPQVTNGYFKNGIKTSQSFISLHKTSGSTYYKTGDLVKINSEGNLLYLGRIDNQIQIRGYRVELGEIEAKIKEFTNCAVLAVGWPLKSILAESIIVFVESDIEFNDLLPFCSKVFPEYMVPSKVIHVKQFPLNVNGKMDRNELLKLIK